MVQVTLQQLQSFISLVQLDKQISDLASDTIALSHEQKKLHTQINDLRHKLSSEEAHLIEAQKKVHAQELEMRSTEQLIQVNKHKLERTKNAKEYTALVEEIEQLTNKQQYIDDRLLNLWEAIEMLQQNFMYNKQQIRQEIEQLTKTSKHLDARSVRIQNQQNELYKTRPEVAQQIEPQVLSQYESIRGRIDKPTVPVRANSCAGCLFTLSSLDMQKLQEPQIIVCKECFRLLYLPEVLDANMLND